jgi:hypothetical protein
MKLTLTFNFERVHPVVFILMYWIYLLPSTQQTIGCNGFYNMFWLTRVIVRLHSAPFGLSSIITYISGGCWSVWSGGCPYTDMNKFWKHISRIVTGNRLIFQYRVSSTYDTHLVHSCLLLIIYACGTCSNVARRNIPEVYALFTRTLKLLCKVSSKQLNTGALVFVLAGMCHWILWDCLL